MHQLELRRANDQDQEFAFRVKKAALGPYIESKWGWDEERQHFLQREEWLSRKIFVISKNQIAIGTVSIDTKDDHIYLGDFYLLPEFQNQGIGTLILENVFREADEKQLPVRLQYLKWNPVGELYKRNGFKQYAETEFHFLMERSPK